MLEQIDDALTSVGHRTMMDVQEVLNILLDLRSVAADETQGETDGFIPEGIDTLAGVGDRTG